MKFKRKICYLLCFCIGIFVFPSNLANAQTNENTVLQIESNSTKKVFNLELIDRVTFPFENATCSLEYMKGTNSIKWGVSVSGGVATFTGKISVTGQSASNMMYSKSYSISIGGSKVVYLDSGMPKGNYIATMSGTLMASNGTKYIIPSNARIPFTK